MTNEQREKDRKQDAATLKQWDEEAPARNRGDFEPPVLAEKFAAKKAAQQRQAEMAKEDRAMMGSEKKPVVYPEYGENGNRNPVRVPPSEDSESWEMEIMIENIENDPNDPDSPINRGHN